MEGEGEGMQILPGVMAVRQPESHLDMMSIIQQQAYACVRYRTSQPFQRCKSKSEILLEKQT